VVVGAGLSGRTTSTGAGDAVRLPVLPQRMCPGYSRAPAVSFRRSPQAGRVWRFLHAAGVGGRSID